MKFNFASLLACLLLKSSFANMIHDAGMQSLLGYDLETNKYYGVVQDVEGAGYALLAELGLCTICIDMFFIEPKVGEGVNAQKAITTASANLFDSNTSILQSFIEVSKNSNSSDSESEKSYCANFKRSISQINLSGNVPTEPSRVRSLNNSSNEILHKDAIDNQNNESFDEESSSHNNSSLSHSAEDTEDMGLLILFQPQEEHQTLEVVAQEDDQVIEMPLVTRKHNNNQNNIDQLTNVQIMAIMRMYYFQSFGLNRNYTILPVIFSSLNRTLPFNMIRITDCGVRSMNLMLASQKLHFQFQTNLNVYNHSMFWQNQFSIGTYCFDNFSNCENYLGSQFQAQPIVFDQHQLGAMASDSSRTGILVKQRKANYSLQWNTYITQLQAAVKARESQAQHDQTTDDVENSNKNNNTPPNEVNAPQQIISDEDKLKNSVEPIASVDNQDKSSNVPSGPISAASVQGSQQVTFFPLAYWLVYDAGRFSYNASNASNVPNTQSVQKNNEDDEEFIAFSGPDGRTPARKRSQTKEASPENPQCRTHNFDEY